MNQEVCMFIKQYIAYCRLVAGNSTCYPLLTKEEARLSGGDLFVDWENGNYRYGGYERGQCVINCESHNADECMYHAIYDATWKLASDYELTHRVKRKEVTDEFAEARVTSFKIWLQYMKRINAKWGDRLQIELSAIARTDGFSLGD